MGRHTLTLTTLNELDNGKVLLAFNQALKTIIADIHDRPGEKGKRKATLIVSGEPVLHKDSGVLENIGVQFHVKTAIPTKQTMTYPMKPVSDNAVEFEEFSPHDPNQRSFSYDPVQERAKAAAQADDE